jgi:hypothetical protein
MSLRHFLSQAGYHEYLVQQTIIRVTFIDKEEGLLTPLPNGILLN